MRTGDACTTINAFLLSRANSDKANDTPRTKSRTRFSAAIVSLVNSRRGQMGGGRSRVVKGTRSGKESDEFT